jgi:hypothetical protein
VSLPSLVELLAVGPGVVQVAEQAERLEPRGVRRPSGGDQLVDAHLEVEGELVVHLALGAARVARVQAERAADAGDARHGSARPQAVSRTLNTAVAYSRHTELSRRSCVRRPGELVVLAPAVVLREPPLALHVPALLEPVERLVERRIVHDEGAVGALPDPSGDGVAVHRLPGQRLEHQHVERAVEEIDRRLRHGRSTDLFHTPGRWTW